MTKFDPHAPGFQPGVEKHFSTPTYKISRPPTSILTIRSLAYTHSPTHHCRFSLQEKFKHT